MAPKAKKEDSLSQLAREEKIKRDAILAVLEETGWIVGGCAGPDAPHTRVSFLGADNCWKAMKERERNRIGTEDVWGLGPPLQQPRYCCSAVSLGSGKLLVVGGFDDMGLPLDSTEIVDGVQGKTFPGPRLQMPRAGCTAVALPLPYRTTKALEEEEEEDESGSRPDSKQSKVNSRQPSKQGVPGTSSEGEEKAGDKAEDEKAYIPWVLVAGGYGPDAAMTTEVLDLDQMKSFPGPTLLAPRSCAGGAVYDRRRVIIMGGFGHMASSKTTEILDVETLKPVQVAEPFFEEEIQKEKEEIQEEKAAESRSMTAKSRETAESKNENSESDDGSVWDGGVSDNESVPNDDEEVSMFGEDEKPFTGPLIPEDVARNWFLPGPSMLESRANFGLVFMPQDEANLTPARFLVLGGVDHNGRRLKTTEWLEVLNLDEDEEAEKKEEGENQPEVEQQPAKTDDMGFGVAGEAEEEPPKPEVVESESEEEEVPPKEFGFQPGPEMLTARSGLGAARLSAGGRSVGGMEAKLIALCAGGVGEDGKPTETTEYYDNKDGEFKPGPPLSWIGKEREEGIYGGFGFCAGTRIT